MKTALRWFAVACLLLAAGVVFATRVSHEMADFQVYRVAGARAVAGEPLYRADDGHWQFKYLPAFAFVVSPFAVVPDAVARGTWFGLSVLLLILLLNRSLALLPDRKRGRVFLVGLTVVFLAKFYLHEINLGQSNLLLGVLVLVAVAQWRAQRPAAAGAWLAAAAVVKPYALVFLPYLVARRRWRSVAGFGAVFVAVLLIPALRYGWAGNLRQLGAWWATVATSTAPNLLSQDNVSIAGMYAAWIGVGPAAWWLAAATSLLLITACGVAVIRHTAADFPEYLDTALLLVVIPLLSPQGWDYVLLLSTPAVMLLVDRLGTFEKREQWLLIGCLAVVGLTLWDLLGREGYRAFMMSRLLTVCVLCEVWFVIRLRIRGAA